MKHFKLSVVLILAAPLIGITASAQNTQAQPGNCAIYAQMSADTISKDKRFKDSKRYQSALETFAKAQKAKMETEMEQTYELSKAYGWDKATVDAKMKEAEKAVRAGFFTSTMDKKKLYMEHVLSVYACAQAASSESDLGQSAAEFGTLLESMATTIRQ